MSLRLSRLSESSTVRHGIVDSNGYPTRTTPSSDSEDSTVYATPKKMTLMWSQFKVDALNGLSILHSDVDIISDSALWFCIEQMGVKNIFFDIQGF